ncbi:MAG: glutamine--fructose-6-phosphate aminotransferase, partial [Bdellovibrionales bacterium]|nr:glutamine--fructose-6-phosphate aminotransferase [Bdellovibrionales bacterium]
MCGIVGYLGEDSPKEVIFNGLKSLEYRGYDSAGVAILDQSTFKRVRAEGKLSELKKKLDSETFSGKIGIGHTRWATHGAPSERNAHPHKAGSSIIVHNGIIENYSQLKDTLGDKDYQSDTDSELVAHLIDEELKLGRTLFEAVLNIIPKLEGAYSILAVNEDNPSEMVAFKNGPPLVVGSGKGSTVIASDIQA